MTHNLTIICRCIISCCRAAAAEISTRCLCLLSGTEADPIVPVTVAAAGPVSVPGVRCKGLALGAHGVPLLPPVLPVPPGVLLAPLPVHPGALVTECSDLALDDLRLMDFDLDGTSSRSSARLLDRD